MVDLIRKGNGSVCVKIAKIAEVEGQRDEKAIAIRLVKRQNVGTEEHVLSADAPAHRRSLGLPQKDLASRFKSVAAEARTIKHYRAKVMDAIKTSAKRLVETQFNRAAGTGGGPASFFEGDNFDWFYGDLVTVEEELEKRFPKDWKVRGLVDWPSLSLKPQTPDLPRVCQSVPQSAIRLSQRVRHRGSGSRRSARACLVREDIP